MSRSAENGHSAGTIDIIKETTPAPGAPSADWREVRAGEHFVQFYDSDEILLDSLAGFVGAGIDAGEGCIAVATREHLEALERLLNVSGRDVVEAGAAGRFIAADAAETLNKFSSNGRPNAAKFKKVIGSLIRRAAAGGRPVRVFGEVMALLAAGGRYEDAVRVEDFWNDLANEIQFTRFCAYPTKSFDGDNLAEPMRQVCGTHSRVIPAESYSGIENEDERLRAIAMLQQRASVLETEIAERKRLFMLEQRARAEAERANRMKDEFLATLSHELRTPLNAIIGWASMLDKETLDPAMYEKAVDSIRRNAKIQAQLVEDILDVSRMITGNLRLQIAEADAVSIINNAIDSVLPGARAKEIHIEVTLDPSVRHIHCDSERLQQAVWNLLSNAVKFTGEGGEIEVSLEPEDGDIRIEVRDNGCGVAPEYLPLIFDRFCQVDGSQTRRIGGLGLGLAIVKCVAELHGGSASAESEGVGFGSTFSIVIPMHPAESSEKVPGVAAHDLSSLPSVAFPGVKMLIVDDDRDSLEMLKFALRKTAGSIETAPSAADALEKFKWFEPDVLISDVGMPGEDGLSLIQKIRDLESVTGRRTPSIALTAFTRIEDRARALNAGFDMFVPKPVELDELIAAVSNLIEQK